MASKEIENTEQQSITHDWDNFRMHIHKFLTDMEII